MKIISVGEILWDVFENGEHLGGAPFNFAAHAARLGHEVFFVSAVGADERGRLALEKASALGLTTRYISTVENEATGTVTVNLDPAGQPHFVIHRPAAYDFAELTRQGMEELSSQRPDWVCFGTLHQMRPEAKGLTRRLIESNPGAQCFYDVNLRVDSYETSLVRDLLARADVVKLNDSEVVSIGEMLGQSYSSVEDFCRSYAREFSWEAVCVTRGAEGCSVLIEGHYVEASGYPIPVADTVGAGDAFAAAFLHGLGAGLPAAEIADFSNRVGALIASKDGAIPAWSVTEARALAE